MKHRAVDVLIGFGIGVALTFALSVHGETITYTAVETPQEILIEEKIDWTEERIIQAIRDTFPEKPETMVRVARCESGLIPHAHNEKTNDGGLFQINEFYHGEKLRALGLDRLDVQDNLEYARMLYDEAGLQPWSASRKCWSS